MIGAFSFLVGGDDDDDEERDELLRSAVAVFFGFRSLWID